MAEQATGYQEENKEKSGEISINTKQLNAMAALFQKQWLILLLLFLFPLALHVLFKNAGIYHFDSAFDLWAIEETVKTGHFTYSYGWGAPGNIAIMSVLYGADRLVRGDVSAEFVYFLVNFIAASLASVVLYLFVKRLTKDQFVAIAASLLFSVTPIWLSITTYPKTHALTDLCALASGLFVLKMIEDHGWKNVLLGGALMGYAISIRPFSIFFMLPYTVLYIHGTIHLQDGKLSVSKKHWAIPKFMGFAVPMAAIPFFLMLPNILHWGGMSGWLASLAGEQRGGWQGMFSRQSLIALSYVTKSLGVLGWLTAIAGAVYLFIRKQWMVLLALFLWFGSFFFYLGNLSPTEARFLSPAMIAMMILLAFGCRLAYGKNRLAGIALLVLLLITTFSVIYPVIKARHDYSGSRGFAEFVRDHTEENALIIVGDQHVFLKQYGKRQNFVAPDEVRGKARVDLMMETVRNGTPLYLVDTGIGFLTPEERDLIQQSFDIAVIGSAKNEIYQFSELELRLYDERLMKLVLKGEQQENGGRQETSQKNE